MLLSFDNFNGEKVLCKNKKPKFECNPFNLLLIEIKTDYKQEEKNENIRSTLKLRFDAN